MDTRTGYTTNSYLNPIISEWDRPLDTGYFFISPIGMIGYTNETLSGELIGGGVFNSFFNETGNWNGGFLNTSGRYQLTGSVSAMADAGASYFSTNHERTFFWLQPGISWSVGTFTQLRFKAGAAYRNVSGLLTEENTESRWFSSYNAEIQHWRNLNWQFRGSVFGNLQNLTDNIGIRLSADYLRSRNWQITLRTGIEQFNYEGIIENGGAPVGGPPIGGPAQGRNVVVDETDRLFRTGVTSSHRITPVITVNVNADYLNYNSSALEQSVSDYHLSAGVQFSMNRQLGGNRGATAEWKQNDTQVVTLRLNYSGGGQLFILGDFNDWEQPGVPLTRQNRNRYAAELRLDSGAHEYKILLVEGDQQKWIDFSDDTYTVQDGFGGENGLIFID